MTFPLPVLATVRTPDGEVHEVHTQDELTKLTRRGGVPVGPQWQYKTNRAERRKRKRQR